MSHRTHPVSIATSCLLVLPLAWACAGTNPVDAAPRGQAAGSASTESPRSSPGDPCRLLTLAEVQRALPQAAPGKRDRSLENAGIRRCEWTTATGSAVLLDGDEPDERAIDEARTWAMSFVDPTQRAAEGRVRFEPLTGIGDEAIAVVETEDRAKGFLQSAAYVVVRRGQRQASFIASGLAKGDRRAALTTLSALGAAIAARME